MLQYASLYTHTYNVYLCNCWMHDHVALCQASLSSSSPPRPPCPPRPLPLVLLVLLLLFLLVLLPSSPSPPPLPPPSSSSSPSSPSSSSSTSSPSPSSLQNGQFDVGDGRKFKTLDLLVDHFKQAPMVETSGSVVRLKQPVNATRVISSHIQGRISDLMKVATENFGKAGFWEEFEQLQQHEQKSLFSRKEGAKPENKKKNRYKNILPCELLRWGICSLSLSYPLLTVISSTLSHTLHSHPHTLSSQSHLPLTVTPSPCSHTLSSQSYPPLSVTPSTLTLAHTLSSQSHLPLTVTPSSSQSHPLLIVISSTLSHTLHSHPSSHPLLTVTPSTHSHTLFLAVTPSPHSHILHCQSHPPLSPSHPLLTFTPSTHTHPPLSHSPSTLTLTPSPLPRFLSS